MKLISIDWGVVFASCINVNEYWNKFYRIITNLIATHVPFKSNRRHHSTRLLRYILYAIANKRAAWRRFKRTNTLAASIRFKTQSAWVRRLIRAYATERDHATLNNISLKDYYRVVSRRLYPADNDCFPLCDTTGCPIASDVSKACAFSNAFITNFLVDDVNSPHVSFQNGFNVNVSYDLVITYLCNLKATNSCGPDGIPNIFLRLAAKGLCTPLTILFQRSVFDGLIPDAWRVAKILPLYKGKGDKSDPNSYRPISLTSCIGKVLEAIVKDQCIKHVTDNNLMSVLQHGFCSGKSTVTNLLCADSYLLNAINENCPVDVILLDFARAFDKVPHDKLIDCLSSYMFSYRLISWFKDFLCNRTQYVFVNGACSTLASVKSGVVQGSVVGPFLFTLFINSLCLCVKNSEFLLFADDSKLLRRVDVNGHVVLSNDLFNIATWSKSHGLPLNVLKCCVLHYDGRHSPNPHTSYFIDSVKVASVNSCTDLGVLRQSNGQFKQHIANVSASAARRVGLSLRAFTCRDAVFMRRLFVSYIRPKLEYAAVVWSPEDVALIAQLEKVQRRLTKQIAGFYYLSYRDRLSRLNLYSLKFCRDLLLVCFVFKLLHNMLNITPENVGLKLCINHTRSAGVKLYVHRPNCSVFKSSFMHRATILWNSLPYSVLYARNIIHFKRIVQCHWSQDGAW